MFIPDYRNGQEPFGVWTPAKLIVAPQWASSSDPDFDVGFVVLEPHDGKNIQQVLGASRLGTDQGYQYLVHVTGYPDSENVPITCVNWTSRFSDTQLKFECAGYTGGTSGSPWVTRFIAGSHTGTIVGVIGGYQEGGDTPSLSYSVRFGPAILALYRQAVAAESAAQAGRHPHLTAAGAEVDDLAVGQVPGSPGQPAGILGARNFAIHPGAAGYGMEVHDDSRPDRRRYRRLGGITAGGRLGRAGGRAPRAAAADRLRGGTAAEDGREQTAAGVPTVADTVVNDRDRALAAATQRAIAVAPDILVDADGLRGSPAQAITEAGSGASMLVVGSRGMGAFTALILGSVSRYAAAHAPCPVVVVRDQTTAAHPQVAVGIGDPAEASAALDFAFEEASLRKASLVAVHAWDSGGDVSRATRAMARPGRTPSRNA